ncbi:MAG TPA: biotin/lipoyl-containing protein, partial [Fermentimonas sp.]|nr:biotin/lipoyl-containing protein [Fermentimonas sp.]
MKFVFNFPDLGEGLEEGTVLEWFVKEGQEVKVGDSLVQMETDKVVADIPSPKNGVILKTYGEVGDIIKVGSPLVDIKLEGSEVEAGKTKDNLVSEEERAEKKVDGEVDKTVIEPISESKEDAGAVVGTMEVAAKNDIMPESDEADNKSS